MFVREFSIDLDKNYGMLFLYTRLNYGLFCNALKVTKPKEVISCILIVYDAEERSLDILNFYTFDLIIERDSSDVLSNILFYRLLTVSSMQSACVL